MGVLVTIVAVFLLLEVANVAALYFATGSKSFNALGVFTAWERSKAFPEIHALLRYMAYWVAGIKLIFIALLVAVLVLGEPQLKVTCVGVLIVAVLTFFWRLYPLAREMDARGELLPAGYSKTLALIIVAFLAALGTALGFGIAALS